MKTIYKDRLLNKHFVSVNYKYDFKTDTIVLIGYYTDERSLRTIKNILHEKIENGNNVTYLPTIRFTALTKEEIELNALSEELL